MKKKLLILDVNPTQIRLNQLLAKLSEFSDLKIVVNIFLINEGVLWVSDEYWYRMYHPEIVYYADALDAETYKVDFRSEVIFSSKKSLNQLIESVDEVLQSANLFDQFVSL